MTPPDLGRREPLDLIRLLAELVAWNADNDELRSVGLPERDRHAPFDGFVDTLEAALRAHLAPRREPSEESSYSHAPVPESLINQQVGRISLPSDAGRGEEEQEFLRNCQSIVASGAGLGCAESQELLRLATQSPPVGARGPSEAEILKALEYTVATGEECGDPSEAYHFDLRNAEHRADLARDIAEGLRPEIADFPAPEKREET